MPNVERQFLSDEISKMNKAFTKFCRWLSKPHKNGGFNKRFFDIIGAVKIFELTVQNSDNNYFNVHFHVLAFLDCIFPPDFDEVIYGGYHYKSGKDIFYSEADIFIQKLWKMAYEGKSIKEYENASGEWRDNYVCKIKAIDLPGGLYEVFKYCFKDSDITNYEIFKDLFLGLKGKRLMQGQLYDYIDDVYDMFNDFKTDDIENHMEFKDEEPLTVATRSIEETRDKYREYKKVAIYKKKMINKYFFLKKQVLHQFFLLNAFF